MPKYLKHVTKYTQKPSVIKFDYILKSHWIPTVLTDVTKRTRVTYTDARLWAAGQIISHAVVARFDTSNAISVNWTHYNRDIRLLVQQVHYTNMGVCIYPHK